MLILLQGEAVNVTRGQARPGEDSSDGPTLVWVNLFVRSFEKIDDVRMQFSVQITFRQQWNDNRGPKNVYNLARGLPLATSYFCCRTAGGSL